MDLGFWKTSGVMTTQFDVLALAGSDARAILNDKKTYTNFELTMDVRTSTGGKGYIGIHTNDEGKGYRIALNNDQTDSAWWRKTGSLLSVRNLTDTPVGGGERVVHDGYPGGRSFDHRADQ